MNKTVNLRGTLELKEAAERFLFLFLFLREKDQLSYYKGALSGSHTSQQNKINTRRKTRITDTIHLKTENQQIPSNI